jgi:hypothetical protein
MCLFPRHVAPAAPPSSIPLCHPSRSPASTWTDAGASELRGQRPPSADDGWRVVDGAARRMGRRPILYPKSPARCDGLLLSGDDPACSVSSHGADVAEGHQAAAGAARRHAAAMLCALERVPRLRLPPPPVVGARIFSGSRAAQHEIYMFIRLIPLITLVDNSANSRPAKVPMSQLLHSLLTSFCPYQN